MWVCGGVPPDPVLLALLPDDVMLNPPLVPWSESTTTGRHPGIQPVVMLEPRESAPDTKAGIVTLILFEPSGSELSMQIARYRP